MRILARLAIPTLLVGVVVAFVGPLFFNSITLLFVGLGLALLGLVMMGLLFASDAREQNDRLTREGVAVDGEVVSWEEQKAEFGGHRHSAALGGFITYRFSVEVAGKGKQEITHTDNVWIWIRNRYPVGSRLPVRYLPSDPSVCRIDGQ